MFSPDHPRPAHDRLPLGRRVTTRRATLRGGALALTVTALAACDAGDTSRESSGSPTAEGSAGEDSTQASEAAADEELAAEALAHVDAALALVLAVAARHRAAASLVDGLVQAQQAHRDLLSEAVPDPEPPATATSPADPARAWAALRRREQGLQADLGALALRADSGTFARLLAVMSASVAQHLAALPLTWPATPASGARS